MVIVYFVSFTTVGTWVTDWTNDGLFGDGFHLFNIGVSDHAEAVEAYASENVFTEELIAMAQAAADAEVIGAEDVLGVVEEADFGGGSDV